jgi:hypothetical protein
MPVLSAMTTLTNAEASSEVLVGENMAEGDQEESLSPRKRGSPLKSSTDNPRRKKPKNGNTGKQKPLDDQIAVDDKENNGRRPSPNNSHPIGNNDPESANNLLAGRNINERNKPPEAGVITKIYAENFMW